MKMSRRTLSTGAALALGLLVTSCASPADVQAGYENRKIEDAKMIEDDYHRALEHAQSWDHHVLGIPASGWLPIMIVALVFSMIITGVLIYQHHARAQAVEENKLKIALRHEEVLRTLVERGDCPVCSAEPALIKSMLEEKVEKLK